MKMKSAIVKGKTEMRASEIVVGDMVVKTQSRASSGFSGTVYKAGPKRIGVMSLYQFGAATPDNPPKPLDLGLRHRSEINYLVRDGKIVAISRD